MTEEEIKLRLFESIAANAEHITIFDDRGRESSWAIDIAAQVEQIYKKYFKK